MKTDGQVQLDQATRPALSNSGIAKAPGEPDPPLTLEDLWTHVRKANVKVVKYLVVGAVSIFVTVVGAVTGYSAYVHHELSRANLRITEFETSQRAAFEDAKRDLQGQINAATKQLSVLSRAFNLDRTLSELIRRQDFEQALKLYDTFVSTDSIDSLPVAAQEALAQQAIRIYVSSSRYLRRPSKEHLVKLEKHLERFQSCASDTFRDLTACYIAQKLYDNAHSSLSSAFAPVGPCGARGDSESVVLCVLLVIAQDASNDPSVRARNAWQATPAILTRTRYVYQDGFILALQHPTVKVLVDDMLLSNVTAARAFQEYSSMLQKRWFVQIGSPPDGTRVIEVDAARARQPRQTEPMPASPDVRPP